MSAFGWSLPAGCTTLPCEEMVAYELKIDGVWWAWDEWDNVYESVPGSSERDDGYVYRGKLEWNDSIDSPAAQLRAFVSNQKRSV